MIDGVNFDTQYVQLFPVSTGLRHGLYQHHVDGAEVITKLRWEDVYEHAYAIALDGHPKPESGKDINQNARFVSTWLNVISSGLVNSEMEETFLETFNTSLYLTGSR